MSNGRERATKLTERIDRDGQRARRTHPIRTASFAHTTVALLLAAIAPRAHADPAPSTAKESVIVLPLAAAADVATAEQREQLEDDAASMLSRYQRVDAVTLQDVKQMMTLEAQREEIGCDSDACTAEIVSALGARWAVGGRIERAPDGIALSLVLFDGRDARVVDRVRVHGPRLSDLRVQLAFAVDKVAASLRSPGDPSPGVLLDEVRPKLAMLPLKMTPPSAAVDAALARAGRRAARHLGLALVDADAFAALATSVGCAARDIGCALPAAASHGATLGLGVSVLAGKQRVVRATLLTPDGVVAARAERIAASDGELPDAVLAVVEAAVRRARGDPEDAPSLAERTTQPRRSPPEPALAPTPTPLATWPPDQPDERERVALPCVTARGGESIAARCTVTNRRLHIERAASNEPVEDIALVDVLRVEKTASLGLFPTGVRVALRDGSTLDLVVAASRRDEVVHELAAHAPAPRSDP